MEEGEEWQKEIGGDAEGHRRGGRGWRREEEGEGGLVAGDKGRTADDHNGDVVGGATSKGLVAEPTTCDLGVGNGCHNTKIQR